MRILPTLRQFLLLGCMSVTANCFGQVDQILQSIEQEQAKPSKSRPAQTSNQTQPRPNPKRSPQKSKQVSANKTPSVQIWGPKDRLPRNIAGQLLAGDFKVLGQSLNGHAVLAADDGIFGRTFEVDNLSSGLAPGDNFPSGQMPRLKFTRSNLLIFIERGILGFYTVRSSQPESDAAALARSVGAAPSGEYYGGGAGYGAPVQVPLPCQGGPTTYRAGWIGTPY